MAGVLSHKAVLKCLLRSNMPNVAYNPQGLQNIGFTYSMLPGLRDLYPDDRKFAQSCRRYAVYHNCHPFWGPFLTGALLHTEARVAVGQIDSELLQPLKETTLNSLSAIGDSFFSGSLETACFIILACMIAQGYPAAAFIFLLLWFLSALLLKVATFYIGLSRGMSAVAWLRRFNLVNMGDYLKIFSSFMLLMFLGLSLQIFGGDSLRQFSPLGVVRDWVVPVSALLILSYLAARVHYSRTALLILVCLVLSLGGAIV